jgi:hypothetical protein
MSQRYPHLDLGVLIQHLPPVVGRRCLAESLGHLLGR